MTVEMKETVFIFSVSFQESICLLVYLVISSLVSGSRISLYFRFHSVFEKMEKEICTSGKFEYSSTDLDILNLKIKEKKSSTELHSFTSTLLFILLCTFSKNTTWLKWIILFHPFRLFISCSEISSKKEDIFLESWILMIMH